jgi:homogentisate 1,2-dioxygenase
MYKILPSITQPALEPVDPKSSRATNLNRLVSDYKDKTKSVVVAKQLRWKCIPEPDAKKNITFLDGLFSYCGAGSPEEREGLSIFGYTFNSCMGNDFFYSADGDFLFVPQTGPLHLETEMGKMLVDIGEFGVIPRGIKFRVVIPGGEKVCHKGWICEVFGDHMKLPELGPIGANGLANPQDFCIPKASYYNEKGEFNIYAKFLGEFFMCTSKMNPLDVVSWRGNYYPYKYNLRNYNTINSVSFDHPDPCIFTVMSSMSTRPGVAVLDFVVFQKRFMVAENTFRPPYFHRNTMAEFMGNIYGDYDAKSGGFEPGCSSLHSPMTPHGPETKATEKAMHEDLKPVKYKDTMSFMFESCYLLRIANDAYVTESSVQVDHEYNNCWNDMKIYFDPK